MESHIRVPAGSGQSPRSGRFFPGFQQIDYVFQPICVHVLCQKRMIIRVPLWFASRFSIYGRWNPASHFLFTVDKISRPIFLFTVLSVKSRVNFAINFTVLSLKSRVHFSIWWNLASQFSIYCPWNFASQFSIYYLIFDYQWYPASQISIYYQ